VEQSQDPFVGRWIRQYQVLERLGSGSFGTVYRARHGDLKLDRALKILRPELSQNAELRARFLREAQTASHLRHPNIVPVYDVFDENGLLCIVMELVDSWTLADRIKAEGPLPPAEAARVALQVALALDHAHARGVVHRDVKPSNILLRQPDQAVMLSDFGIARIRTASSSTMRDAMLGTMAYMPPEQLGMSDGQVDWRADLYAMAGVCYEMLTGQPPYGRGTDAIAGHLGQRPLAPMRAHASAIPEAADRVVEKGLAQDPAKRYKSAGELGRDLAAALYGQPVEAITPMLLGTAAGVYVPRRRYGKRIAVVIGALLAAALLVGGPLAVLDFRGQQIKDATRPPVTDQEVVAAAVGHLDRCFDSKHPPPWQCPRINIDSGERLTLQFRGDPTLGATVHFDGKGDFTVHSHFVAVDDDIIQPADVNAVDAAPVVAHVHWDDQSQSLVLTGLARATQGPKVPQRFPINEGFIEGAPKLFLGACAKWTDHKLRQGCPPHVLSSDAFRACTNFEPIEQSPVTFWKGASDPGAGATVKYDDTTGVFTVTGTYSVDESIVQPVQCKATAHKSGNYTMTMVDEPDKDGNADVGFLRFQWT
jgi:serine/threonine-protein kinase